MTVGETKKVLLDIADAIDSFCRDKKLRYYLAYGSLIGAVRHKGFIPWDDDIDIIMPRPDYEVLFSEFKHPYYEIRSQENCPDWPLNFAKMCDIRTISIDQFGSQTPIAVDVFVLDGLGNNEAKARWIVGIVKSMQRLWSNQLFTRKLPLKNEFGLKKNLFILIGKLIHPLCPFKLLLKKMLEYKKRLSVEGSVYCSSLTGICTIFQTSKMLNCIETQFEDRLLLIPEDYDYQLKILYGDYMQVPPENERINHRAIAYWV